MRRTIGRQVSGVQWISRGRNLLYKDRRMMASMSAQTTDATPSAYLHPSLARCDSRFLADTNSPICQLDAKEAFRALDARERLYTHYMAKASWAGARICMAQISQHSPAIVELLHLLFVAHDGKCRNLAEMQREAGRTSKEEIKALAEYAAQVFANLGNFKSFGHTKFIPRCSSQTWKDCLRLVPEDKQARAHELYQTLESEIYGHDDENANFIGKPSEGKTSGYYLAQPGQVWEDGEVEAVQKVLDANAIGTLNTRLEKLGKDKFRLWIASVHQAHVKTLADGALTIEVVQGDHAEPLKGVVAALKECKKYAANENQINMLDDYVDYFTTGSFESFLSSQRHWVKDRGPIVESNIGFIESYVDPYAYRAEWEGFAAVVNKPESEKYSRLVNSAQEILVRLPWGAAFERDEFIKPDFTSLEVVAFGTAGLPAGINLPNDLTERSKHGFKNVSLGNVLSAQAPSQVVTFLTAEDEKLFKELQGPAFGIQVALHELLGHGSGKVFTEESDGTCNFPKDNPPINPLTGKPIGPNDHYKPGQNYYTVFTTTGPSFEEARAECVALFLAPYPDILQILGYSPDNEKTPAVLRMIYLSMVRAGVLALEYYDPKLKKHGQAHMQARCLIALELIRVGAASVELIRDPATNELRDARVHFDSKDIPLAQKAVAALLVEMQVRKATADGTGGREWYTRLSTPPDTWLELRKVVLAKKQPRKLFVQANTVLTDDQTVEYREYPATLEGIMTSYLERGL